MSLYSTPSNLTGSDTQSTIHAVGLTFPKSTQISDIQNTLCPKGLDKEPSKESCSGRTFSINSASAAQNPEPVPYLGLKNGSPLFFGSKRLFKHFNVLLAI